MKFQARDGIGYRIPVLSMTESELDHWTARMTEGILRGTKGKEVDELGMPASEVKLRAEYITALRSVVAAAHALQLPYGTLSKWYHDHRDLFSAETQEAVKQNGGSRATLSQPRYQVAPAPVMSEIQESTDEEVWEVRQPDKFELEDLREDGVGDPAALVNALVTRLRQLLAENRRLRGTG